MGRGLRLVSVGSIVADIRLDVPHLPTRGGDVIGSAASVTAGGWVQHSLRRRAPGDAGALCRLARHRALWRSHSGSLRAGGDCNDASAGQRRR